MAFVFAIIAVICFASPDISVIDFLPDVIGCLMLYFALSVPSEFSTKLVDARAMLFKLTFVTGADFIISLFLSTDDPTMILLMSFCFGIAEAMMAYIIVEKIFDGMTYLGTKFPAVGIYMPISEKKKEKYRAKFGQKYRAQRERALAVGDFEKIETIDNAVERYVSRKSDNRLRKLIKLTHFFIVFRAAMNILPEFTALSSYGYSGDVTVGAFDISRFRGLFVLFAVFFTAVASIVWLCKIIPYISGIKRDTEFLESMKNAYSSDVTSNSGLLYYRRMKLAMVLISIAVVASFDFTVDHINIIPDFISAAAVLLFWCLFLRDKKKPTPAMILTLLYGITSAAQWFSIKHYINNYYDFTRTMKSEKAMTAYIVCCVITLAAEILFVFMLRYVFGRVHELIYESTGFLTRDGERDDYSKKLHSRLDKQNNRAAIFSIIVAVVSVAYMILIGINKGVEAMEDGIKYIVYVPVFESIGVVQMIVTVLFIIYTVKHFSDVSDGLDERYKLD